MAKKLQIKAIDEKGQLFIAQDQSAFRLETAYTQNKISKRELSGYLHDILIALEKAFKNEEINLAAYLVLSRYAGRRATWSKHPIKEQEVEIWDLNALLDKAKQKKSFKFLGVREK